MWEEQQLRPGETVLVEFLREQRGGLVENWLQIVATQSRTPTFHSFDPDSLRRWSEQVYEHLARWIEHDFFKGDIASYYRAEGAGRRREGFGLAEVIRSFLVCRRVLWFRFKEEGLLLSALEAQAALDLTNRVVLFFDHAVLATVSGFEQK